MMKSRTATSREEVTHLRQHGALLLATQSLVELSTAMTTAIATMTTMTAMRTLWAVSARLAKVETLTWSQQHEERQQ